MIALYETIIWNILGGEKEKWIYHDEPKKELIFSFENEEERVWIWKKVNKWWWSVFVLLCLFVNL